MGLADENQLGNLMGLGTALAAVLQAVLGTVFAIFGVLSSLISALPLILIALVVTAAMLPWIVYHDNFIEQAELAVRGTVYPIWRDHIRDIVNFVRELYNPVICWWNALNWWGYGMIREVLLPTILQCGVRPLFFGAGAFVKAVGEDILLYLGNGSFLTQDADFTQVTTTGIALFQAWINFYYCTCSDLADIVFVLPIVNPLAFLPPAYPLMAVLAMFSGQWLDPQWWCTLANAFNAIMSAARELIRLASQILAIISGSAPPGTQFNRPDLRFIVDKLCPMINCFMRSMENAIQLIWDRYVPFEFVFTEYLCVLDSLACIVLKTFALVVRILINIDRCVLYPSDIFWEDVAKPDMLEILNLYAPPSRYEPIPVPRGSAPLRYTMIDYYYDTASENTPLGRQNPVFGSKRLVDCVCNLIQRTICDPSAEETGCFSQGAQNLLMGLDFCCLTTRILILAVDLTTGLIEFSMHLSKGPDDFFLFVDNQPFTTILKDDLVSLAHCIFSFFGLIPVVGTCIRDLLVGLIRLGLCLIDFSIRTLIGLLTLPYYLIAMQGVNNFVMEANVALDFFIAIHDDIIADVPGSIKNCICAILNNGFPVPPVPCSSCQVGGFVEPAASKKRRSEEILVMYDRKTGRLTSPLDLMRQVWGIPAEAANGAAYALTPMIRYNNHTTNPVELYNRIRENAKTAKSSDMPFPNMADFNAFIDEKRDVIFDRYLRERKCNRQKEEEARTAAENPTLYAHRKQTGFYKTCDVNSHTTPVYERPSNVIDERVLVRHENGTFQERLIQGETLPPVVGCSDPIPPCFDLCCIVRSSLELLIHIIKLLARFFNGMIQGNASQQGTIQDFPYFTGEFETLGKATFESDFVTLILKIFKPIQCACQVLNLIIPVQNGREDICCFVQRVSELIACTFQVLIQAISALAMGGSTNYVYFKDTNMFMKDVSTLFDIILAIVDCLCVLAQAIFPLNYIPGFSDATNFDICCLAQALLVTITEIARTVMAIVLSIALIGIEENEGGSSAFCFWRLDRVEGHECSGTLDGIGIIKQLDVVIDSFFPRHGQEGGACLKYCHSDNGATGIVPCLCQIFNTLIPFRRFPAKATNCDADDATRNCPILDFCCPFAKLGFAIGDALKFTNRAAAGLWQSWEGGLPEFFVNYIWCDEGRIPPCSELGINIQPVDACSLQKYKKVANCVGTLPVLDSNNTIALRCGEYTCGKLNIVIDDLTNPHEGLLAKCMCQIFSLLDYLLSYVFKFIQIAFPWAGWSCCFCGGFQPDTGFCEVNKVNPCLGTYGRSSGVLPALSYVATALLKAIIRLLRAFPLYCYWNPNVNQETFETEAPSIIEETWIFSFLAPTADAICIASGNMICFAQSMFFLPRTCLSRGEKFAGGIARWAFEVVFRVIGFIEAFVQSFLHPAVTCVGPTCEQKAGSQEQSASVGDSPGVNAKPLGNMLVILMSIPIDLLIGDGDIACTTVCPSRLRTVPTPLPCDCWNKSPRYGQNSVVISYNYTTDVAACTTDYRRTMDGVDVINTHVGAEFGDTSGCCLLVRPELETRAILPVCQNPNEVPTTVSTGYPGSCTVLVACRPDSLPSCANDPETPPGLSANYIGALDGIVMALTRYLRCMLDNLFGCDSMGENCTVKLGLIFYPGVLIMSIAWQILGGVIRFNAAMLIFILSLFTATGGNGCECWTRGRLNGYGNTQTRYWRKPGGELCYVCYSLDTECDVKVTVNTVDNSECKASFVRKCAPWCPIWHRAANPLITAAEAHAMCITAYENGTKTFPYIQKNPRDPAYDIGMDTATICSGVKAIATTVWELDSGQVSLATKTWGTFVNTTKDTGWCYPPAGWGGGNPGPDSPWEFYVIQDACPAPHCQNPNVLIRPNDCSGTDCYGIWPCGAIVGNVGTVTNKIWDCNSPNDPLVTCGGLQIVSNFLDVFKSFVEIFTTPILIPTKRDNTGSVLGSIMQRYSGKYNRRESIQRFKQRFDGVVTGLHEEGSNFAEVLTAAVYDYDTSDCFDDPMTCHCRNLDMPDHCRVDDVTGQVVFGPSGKRKRDDGTSTNMTVPDLTMVVKEEVFVGTSVCDHTVSDSAGLEWSQIPETAKNQYVKCLDRFIQGTRMNHVANVVPVDIGYNSNAPVTLMSNIFHGVQTTVRKRFERAQRPKIDARAELERKFPKFNEQLLNRSFVAERVLIQKYGITQQSFVFDAIVKADAIWFKYATGYYDFIFEKMLDGIAAGESIVPTTQEALVDLKLAAQDLKTILLSQNYYHVVQASVDATRAVSKHVGEILDEGVIDFATRTYRNYVQQKKRVFTRSSDEKANLFEQSWYVSPLYQWWNVPKNEKRGLAPFMRHMSNVVEFQRNNWQTQSLNFFNADLKFWSMADVFKNRFSKPEWTPVQLQHLEKLKRVYYQAYNRIWPGHLSNDVRERFLFNSNCVIADRALNVTVKVIDYCANEFVPNLNITKKRNLLSYFSGYFEQVSKHREETYYGYKNRPRFTEEHSVPGDTASWIRPRLIMPNATERKSHKVDYRVYRRGGLANKEHGPAGFNLFYWLIGIAEDLTGYAIGAQSDTWYSEIRAWILNPNTDISQYPDVGLAYAIRYPFTCHFPESLNCSIGTGLETALIWVSLGFIVLLLVAGYAMPIALAPFTAIGLGLSYLIVLSAVAWHFPPACLIMTPSFPLGFGITLPHCLLDQVMALADKVITNCYSPWLLPAYMIAGDVCPTDPTQAIDFLNCADVGVSDGIQNILYLGFWLLGQGFCDFVLNISATLTGFIFPGLQNYMELTLNSFKTASETNRKRMTFCFWATLPTVFLPAIALFIVGMLLAVVLPQLLLLLNASVQLLFASPVAAGLPGGQQAEEAWFGQDDAIERPSTRPRGVKFEEDEDEDEEEPSSYVSAWFRKAIYGSVDKRRKRKME